MQKLVYVPPNSNEQVILTAAEPIILSSVAGLGGVESDVISSEVVGMDGVFYHGCKKTPRPIPCTVYVKGKNREDMYRQRLKIIGLLRAENDVGTLYYSNDYISVKIGAVPITPPDFVERIKNYNKADLKFWCPQPLWQSLETKTASIAKISGIGFEMPFSFPVTFSHIRNEIVINNLGTARAPVTITITGTGVNPEITNTTNGKTISLLDKTLSNGEQLIINTERGYKSVKLKNNRTETDGFQYINPLSDFWEFEVGENKIVYSSDDNAEATSIVITYNERFEGV